MWSIEPETKDVHYSSECRTNIAENNELATSRTNGENYKYVNFTCFNIRNIMWEM